MKFKYNESVKVEKEVDLELPYYYEVIGDDYQIYGKLTENELVELMHMIYDDNQSWELDKRYDVNDYIRYILKQEKSTKKRFESAKQLIVEFLA